MPQRKPKVVITDYDFPSVSTEKAILEKAGADVIEGHCKTENDVIKVAFDADAIINQYVVITRGIIENLQNCRIIVHYGIGIDKVDVEAATEHGIYVANIPDYCVDEVSSHAMALILDCTRKIVFLNNALKRGQWDFKLAQPIRRISMLTLAIAGFGKIAGALAEKARGFGLRRILAHDPYVSPEAGKQFGVEMVDMTEFLEEADILSIHLPLTKETKHMFGEKEFQMMKKSAIIINTSRGAVIDEVALIKALREGQLAGAGLDVFEKEPASFSNPLLRMENVVVTPHVAWYSEESFQDLQQTAAEEVARVLHGKIPNSLVNREVIEYGRSR